MGAENLGASVTVDAPSLTIKEFCELEKIGRTTFFKMAKEGSAPEVSRVPGPEAPGITKQLRLPAFRSDQHDPYVWPRARTLIGL
jgi:hypothetical protein